MDTFIVSARKYRPQAFDTVVGQSHITTTLKNAIKHNQLAHAFLFCGPRGVGKTTCARILAKTINCENLQPDGEACNQCTSCRTFNEGTSLNIHELDAASNNSVDDIRTLVEQVRFAPQAGKYKVYIVDEVHMLSSAAFNAFLKTLEEPPHYAIFILATTEKHKILPTILSRCQIFDFKRITNNDTVEHLQEIVDKENIKAERAALQVIAQKSEGCMRDALSILDKIVSFTGGEVTYQNTLEHLNILDHDYFFRLLEYLLQQDLPGVLLLYNEINDKGFEGDLVLNGFAEFLRNLLVCKDEKAASLLEVVEGIRDKYINRAKETGASFIVSALNILNEAAMKYKMARNKKLHTELAFIKLNFLQQAISLTAENGGLIKKKRIDGPVAYRTKPVQSLQVVIPEKKKEDTAARLYVEKENSATAPAQSATASRPAVKTTPVVAIPQTKKIIAPTAADGKKNLLHALRDKYGGSYIIEEIKDADPLQEQKLSELWQQYASKLDEQKKFSAAASFRNAKLEINDDNFFTATVNGLTQQKFIETEKTFICDIIQQAFSNRSIQFKVIVQEDMNKEEIPAHLRMNSRQRFERIAEKYPLVRELKNKLGLDLDY